MKYVIKRDGQKTEIFQLEGYVLSTALATVSKNTIVLNADKSVFKDAEFIEALLASFPDQKFDESPEPVKCDLPPVEQTIYSCVLTGPCTRNDIQSATGFSNQKIGVAIGGLIRKGRVVLHPNGEYTVAGGSPSADTPSDVTPSAEETEPPEAPYALVEAPFTVAEFVKWVKPDSKVPGLDEVYGSPIESTTPKRVLVVGGLEDKVKLKDMNERFRGFTFEWLPTYRDSSRNMKFLSNTSRTYDVVVILEGLVSHSVNEKVVQWCRRNKTRFTYALKGGRASIATALNVR